MIRMIKSMLMVSYPNENKNNQILSENIRVPEKLSVTLLRNTKAEQMFVVICIFISKTKI